MTEHHHQKDFLVTPVGAELDQFEKPTYVVFLPDSTLLDDKNVQSALSKLAPLVHAGDPQIKFETVGSHDSSVPDKKEALELTCMDAREFSPASRTKLLGKKFLTFAGSGFFLHPEIDKKLRAAGHGDLVDALIAILAAAQEKGLKIDIVSNHFGEDGGCGGLNFVKNNCGGLEIPDGAAYRRLLEETRTELAKKFPELTVEDAKLIMHQTGADGVIVESFNLANPNHFAAFDAQYDGKF